jgi:hypothetical protein
MTTTVEAKAVHSNKEPVVESSTLADDIAIAVRNVSTLRVYPLYPDPRDRLKQSLWYALPGFVRGHPRQFFREFWALRDCPSDGRSFEVKKGKEGESSKLKVRKTRCIYKATNLEEKNEFG